WRRLAVLCVIAVLAALAAYLHRDVDHDHVDDDADAHERHEQPERLRESLVCGQNHHGRSLPAPLAPVPGHRRQRPRPGATCWPPAGRVLAHRALRARVVALWLRPRAFPSGGARPALVAWRGHGEVPERLNGRDWKSRNGG